MVSAASKFLEYNRLEHRLNLPYLTDMTQRIVLRLYRVPLVAHISKDGCVTHVTYSDKGIHLCYNHYMLLLGIPHMLYKANR